MNLDLAIGTAVRSARNARHLGMRTIARRAHMSFGYISEVERGLKSASSEHLAALCEALEVPISTILYEATDILLDEERRIHEA